MKMIHVLNGDALAKQISSAEIDGEVIVCRECLIEGPLQSITPTDFWQQRATFISEMYGIPREEYIANSKDEIEKLLNIHDEDEINLWFEDDLFCQANMWFIISMLKQNTGIYRIFPIAADDSDHWRGFSLSDDKMLKSALNARVKFDETDIRLAKSLWESYSSHDLDALATYSAQPSICFRNLEEVCTAHIQRFSKDGNSRPEQALRQIISEGDNGFVETFKKFSAREGIYGFGDSQVKRIYDRLISETIN